MKYDDRAQEAEKLVLNASEVSRLLGLSRGSVYQAIATGQIPSIRIGRRILISRASLRERLEGAASGRTELQEEQGEASSGDTL